MAAELWLIRCTSTIEHLDLRTIVVVKSMFYPGGFMNIEPYLSKTRRLVALVAVATVVLTAGAGCGGSGSDPTPAVSPNSAATSTATSTDTLPAPTDAAPSPSAEMGQAGPSTTDDGTSSVDGSTDDGSTPKPPVLDKQSSGRDLTLADFFTYPEGWGDGRFTVAGQPDLAGISGNVDDCSSEVPSDPSTIELRLSNNFSKISMKVGQADDSASSDSVVTVRVAGNGTYRDEVHVPFNKLTAFSTSVAGVNALKIQVWKGGEACDSYKDVKVVLTQLRVE